MQNKIRPKFLNLFVLAPKMPITAKISILHRVSGVLLFLAIPFLLNILHRSLISPDFYSIFYGFMSCGVAKLIYLVVIWAFTYHACAGIRFLFLDIHQGVSIQKAKFTAYLVAILSLILTLVLGIFIW